jgi:hypothetical protein
MSDVRDNQLEARGKLDGVTLVRMGDTQFFPVQKNMKYGSYGFDGCIGLLVIGKSGALIGHHACTSAAIADTDPILGGKDTNPKAAIHAIPTALEGENLGDSVKSYIFAQTGTDQARINELATILAAQRLPVPSIKPYSLQTGAQGAGFIATINTLLPNSVTFSNS